MRKLHLLKTQAFGVGSIPFSLQNLPKGKKIEAIRVRADLVATTGAAAALIAGSGLFRLFQTIRLGGMVDTTGMQLRALAWLTSGREPYLPASIPATNSKPFQRVLQVDIPYSDQGAREIAEGAPPTEDSQNVDLQVIMAAFASLGAATWGTLASITGTVRVYAVLADNAAKKLAPRSHIGYVDDSGQTFTLPPGLYKRVWLANEDGSAITSAEVTSVAIDVDGEPYCDTITLAELIEQWNMEHAATGTTRADSATAPVAGARITCVPSAAADADASFSAELVPLITMPKRAKLSQAVLAEQSIRIQFTGSKTTFRIGFERIEPYSESGLYASFQRLGVPVTNLGQLTSDTHNGEPLTQRAKQLARFIPVKVQGS